MSSAAHAGKYTYECEIKQLYDIDDAGSLQISAEQGAIVDRKFTVSRISGEIQSETLSSIPSTNTHVMIYGSNEYSFKSVAAYHGQYQLLEVLEFREGIKKPFILSSMDRAVIVTGLCR